MDDLTAGRKRLLFARVCVLVEAGASLPEKLVILNPDGSKENVTVEYEWKPIPCHLCGCFGHAKGECQAKENSSKPPGSRGHIWKAKPPPADTMVASGADAVLANGEHVSSSCLGGPANKFSPSRPVAAALGSVVLARGSAGSGGFHSSGDATHVILPKDSVINGSGRFHVERSPPLQAVVNYPVDNSCTESPATLPAKGSPSQSLPFFGAPGDSVDACLLAADNPLITSACSEKSYGDKFSKGDTSSDTDSVSGSSTRQLGPTHPSVRITPRPTVNETRDHENHPPSDGLLQVSVASPSGNGPTVHDQSWPTGPAAVGLSGDIGVYGKGKEDEFPVSSGVHGKSKDDDPDSIDVHLKGNDKCGMDATSPTWIRRSLRMRKPSSKVRSIYKESNPCKI